MNLSIKEKAEIIDKSAKTYKALTDLEVLKPKKFLARWAHCFLIIFKKIFNLNFRLNVKKFENDLIYVNSENTRNTLAFLKGYGMEFEQVSTLRQSVDTQNLTHFKFSLLNLLELPIGYYYFLKKDFSFASKNPEFLFENWGKLEFNLKVLSQSKTKNVFIANDHNIHNRLFIEACKLVGVKTFYFQHGGVSKRMPALDFDVSFLYGQNDADIYKNLGSPRGEIYLYGNQKIDKSLRKKNLSSKCINRIGVSINSLDCLHKVKKLCEYLDSLGKELVLRPHPRIKNNVSNIKYFKKISISNPLEQNETNYLASLDMHISGESTMHLSSVCLNIPSIYYKLHNGKIYDSKGYIEKGLIVEASSLLSIKDFMDNYIFDPNLYLKANYFDGSIGKKWEHNIKGKMLETLKRHL